VLAARWQATNEAVRGLFGFDSTQFRQVVVLPQDQFRQLLKASSTEREALFQALFQTEIYSQVETALKDVAKALATTIRDQRNRMDILLQAAGKPNADAVDAQVADLSVQQQAQETKLAGLQAKEQAAAGQRQLAEAVEQRFTSVENANKVVAELQQRKSAIEADRQILAAARRTLMLVDSEQMLKRHSLPDSFWFKFE